MANLNVSDNSAFGNYRDHYTSNYAYSVRESEPDYPYNNANTPSKANTNTNNPEPTTNNCFGIPTDQSLWPQFPDGAYLNTKQATGLYRAAQGISGLVFVLNRSAHLRGLARDYQNEPDHSLSEVQESKVWNALIKLSADLNNLADDLQNRAAEDTRL